jgi:pre-rRNA-processing protein TSR3
MDFFDCLIIRHRKENLRKCSLRGLEGKKNFAWVSYPQALPEPILSNLEGCILLDMDGEILTENDTAPLILLDATWRYAAKMRAGLPQLDLLPRRRLPDVWRTAYPRKQTECSDPERGLASIEAIFAAFYITGRSTEGLLDAYYWKNQFLEKNNLISQS